MTGWDKISFPLCSQLKKFVKWELRFICMCFLLKICRFDCVPNYVFNFLDNSIRIVTAFRRHQQFIFVLQPKKILVELHKIFKMDFMILIIWILFRKYHEFFWKIYRQQLCKPDVLPILIKYSINMWISSHWKKICSYWNIRTVMPYHIMQ